MEKPRYNVLVNPTLYLGFPGGASGKEPACQCRFDPWVRKIPWRREWQPTPAFLPGESHGQRILAGYSPWGHKESDTTEVTAKYCIWVIKRKHFVTIPFPPCLHVSSLPVSFGVCEDCV